MKWGRHLLHTAQSSGQEEELIRVEYIGPSWFCVAWVPEGHQEGGPETHSIQSREEFQTDL